MKTEIKLSEAIGKTLATVEFALSGQCVIIFNDDTFTTLGIEQGYDPGDEQIVEDRLNIFEFGDTALVRVGIATFDELMAMRQAKNDKRQAEQEIRERCEFERLKRKFSA